MAALFPDLPEESAPVPPAPGGRARLREAERRQVALRAVCLDDLLEADHQARAVWGFVEGLDLSALRAAIRSVAGGAGHPAADPKILVSLWLYATLRGVGSARELARLCGEHVAYQWLCGGVGMNHHTLADFRTGHGGWLDAALTASVAVLLHQGAVTLERVAQDGVRVRASAGAASFRRAASLRACEAAAAAQVAALRAELDADDPAAGERRRRAARGRAAAERAARVEAALAALPAAEARARRNGGGEARVSTTDAEARVMKMADGGFRPAYNVQFAADTASQVVVGVDVGTLGGDQPSLVPMAERIAARYGRLPAEYLVDGGFVSLAAIEQLGARGVAVHAPPPKPRGGRDAGAAREDDGPGVAAWRARMQSEAGKAIYRERAATIECVNAQARRRGLTALPVRGLDKVRAVALWHALAHNLARILAMPAASPA
jgi:transposase